MSHVGVAKDESSRAHDFRHEGETEEDDDSEAGKKGAASARHSKILVARRRYNSSMSQTGPEGARRACAIVVGAFALFCAWFTGFFPPFSNPNDLSRFEMVVAFVETGSFAIDSQLATLGDHEDKAVAGGRFYSNKAPGLAFAAIPVYRLLRLVLPPPDSPTAPILALVRLFTVSVACVLALAAFARRLLLRREWESLAAVVTFAVAFGTPFLYYARSFFGHAWTASLLFLAWDALSHRGSEGSARGHRGVALAGFLAGWALISEYTVAPVALALAVRAAIASRDRRPVARLLLFGAGAALPLAVSSVVRARGLSSLCRARAAAFLRLRASEREGGLRVSLPPGARHPALFTLLSLGGCGVRPLVSRSEAASRRGLRPRRDGLDVSSADGIPQLARRMGARRPVSASRRLLRGAGSRYLLPLLFFPAAALPWALRTPISRGLFVAATAFSAATHLLETFSWPHFPADVR